MRRRHHRVRSDFPPELGGRDSGPVPGELLLSALAGCVASAYVRTASARGIALDALTVGLELNADLRGTLELDGVAVEPSSIDLVLRVRSDADEAALHLTR